MRLIDADALKERKFPNGESDYATGWNDAVDAIMENSPTIDAAPIRRGTWTEEYDPNADLFFRRRWRCSACNGWNTYGTPNYCPDCGAEMTNSTKKMKEAKDAKH